MKSTVAIVDDDSGVRTALSSLLRALGCEVRTYAGAREFIDAVPPLPDLLISDIQMPGCDGEQLLAELRARGRHLPTVFMTAFPNTARRQRLLAAGALACLDKPVEADTLAGFVAALVPRAERLDPG
ncbi:MAG TPA: response regulator [Stenotrophomonas sp.]|jgi:FixJ family two-component response regulator